MLRHTTLASVMKEMMYGAGTVCTMGRSLQMKPDIGYQVIQLTPWWDRLDMSIVASLLSMMVKPVPDILYVKKLGRWELYTHHCNSETFVIQYI